MTENLTVADLVQLEFYTLKMSHELDDMAERAKLTDKMILKNKASFFKLKNVKIQKRLMEILDTIN